MLSIRERLGFAAVLCGSLVGCGGAGDGDAQASDANAAMATSLDGCVDSVYTVGDFGDTMMHDGAERRYAIHVPTSYDGSEAVPLVLDFHGFSSNGTQQMAFGWSRKSDEEGFIVVHPDGLASSWNGGELCCGQSLANDVDDVGFALAIVARLREQACIDPRRVYVTGLSNGGAMTHYLACDQSGVFAAAAPVSMGNGVESCQPERPISVIMFRATGDQLVAYEGGMYPSAAEDFAQWKSINGCSGDPEPTYGICETYFDCDGGVEVTLCTLDAGHLPYDNADDLSIPDVAWEAFERQPLP